MSCAPGWFTFRLFTFTCTVSVKSAPEYIVPDRTTVSAEATFDEAKMIEARISDKNEKVMIRFAAGDVRMVSTLPFKVFQLGLDRVRDLFRQCPSLPADGGDL